ncbi:MAG TPA: hypothetical protein V6D35_11475 [Candidatus Sericytochromatia bacterium]|jgi:hypothetical protein
MKTSNTRLTLHQEHLQNPQVGLAIFPVLRKTLQYLMQTFIGSNDLRIWLTCDRFGKNWWHVYDPITGRHSSVDSEEKLREWIEKRYYN